MNNCLNITACPGHPSCKDVVDGPIQLGPDADEWPAVTGDDNTGDDIVFGGDGDGIIYGGEGNDELAGEAGNDWLEGQDGDDRLNGGDGSDTLMGGNGNDHLYVDGSENGDLSDGGEGNDCISGLIGDDYIIGGPGDDEIWINDNGNHDTVEDFGTGGDKIVIYNSNICWPDLTVTAINADDDGNLDDTLVAWKVKNKSISITLLDFVASELRADDFVFEVEGEIPTYSGCP